MTLTTENKTKDKTGTPDNQGQGEKRRELMPWLKLRNIPVLKLIAAPETSEIMAANEAGLSVGEWAPFEDRGTVLGRDKKLSPARLAVPGAPTTTRQAEILNTAKIAAPTGIDGVTLGRDVLSQTVVAKDPFTDYNAVPRRASSPNVCFVGDVGAGKSSACKCGYVLRPVILRNRRAVVFDKKNEQGEGEYAQISRFFGNDPIRYALDGSGVRMNLLDPEISGTNDDGLNNQLAFLNTVPALLREGHGADEWERKALRLAYREVMRTFEGARTPTTADLHARLGVISRGEHSLFDMSDEALERLHEAGVSMRWVFDELLDHYGAIFDGETSNGVQLNGKVTTFDVSQLPETGPVIPMVMGLSNLWLLGRVRRDKGMRTNVIIEEAGHILGGPMATQQRSNIKLSRGLGISNIYCFHKETDVPAGSPGMAVIEEAQTVNIFRLERPKAAEWAVSTFGLNAGSAEDIMRLANGHYMLKGSGSVPEFEVEHVRSDWEIQMTNTDSAMAETATVVG
ncbi:ATP/GTP-binding protein [Arthrobacter sp.]|uniref:ATP/GTP-binding protein n=1 Tax=Arthrobacter sp. TaxID=1667 RepID=UPI003A92B7E7